MVTAAAEHSTKGVQMARDLIVGVQIAEKTFGRQEDEVLIELLRARKECRARQSIFASPC